MSEEIRAIFQALQPYSNQGDHFAAVLANLLRRAEGLARESAHTGDARGAGYWAAQASGLRELGAAHVAYREAGGDGR